MIKVKPYVIRVMSANSSFTPWNQWVEVFHYVMPTDQDSFLAVLSELIYSDSAQVP